MVSQEIERLIKFCLEVKNKKPDYVILSKEKYIELCYELQAPNMREFHGLDIVTTHYAGKDFLQVGFGCYN
jgi:hypothetical protein